LIITSQPKPPHLPAGWSAEHLLRQSGSPVLLIPTARPGDLVEPHIVIAWNGSAKARRAVNDALPLLRMASRVTVLIVDAQRHPEIHGEDPGRDVVDHLARHGILALTRCVAAEGHPVSEVIATEADGLDADLVVIGAYSRSRATEMIFGGVTRALLAKAPRPLFISN
jgi:nucleotide-binding universal stress UspA family protein